MTAKRTWAFMLTAALASASASAKWNRDSTEYDTFDRFRVGGYGELMAAFKNYGINRFNGTQQGNSHIHRGTISIPRFTIAGDYKWNRRWRLGLEIEFENGGTGTVYELENTENGEYETEIEKGGEVVLEQLHITYSPSPWFNLQMGHVVLPVGTWNLYHEPINYLSAIRPEGERSMVPATWHETGIKLYGQFGRRWASFQWAAMLTEGLNANGFDRNNWVASGKQGLFEDDNFTSPAYTARLSYSGLPGLTIGGTFYYCANAAANSDKPQTYSFRVPVRIWSADARYNNTWLTATANLLRGNLSNSAALTGRNVKLSNNSPYTRTAPIAHKAACYGMEAGLKLKGLVAGKRMPDLIPFARYEYYNAQQQVDAPYVADERLKTSLWTAGLNYRPIPFIIIKADYTQRRIGGGAYNSENEFALGVAFAGWFFSDRTTRKKS